MPKAHTRRMETKKGGKTKGNLIKVEEVKNLPKAVLPGAWLPETKAMVERIKKAKPGAILKFDFSNPKFAKYRADSIRKFKKKGSLRVKTVRRTGATVYVELSR